MNVKYYMVVIMMILDEFGYARRGLATYFRSNLRGFMKDWTSKNLKKDGTKYNLYVDGLKIYTTACDIVNTTFSSWVEGV